VLNYTRVSECVISDGLLVVRNYTVVIWGVTSVVGFGVPNYTSSIGGVGLGWWVYACAWVRLVFLRDAFRRI